MRKEESYIESTNKKDRLHVITWKPEGKIIGIVQISHGMIEYVERFEGFASFLASKGILVIGNDHLGHGMTASKDEDLGYIDPGMSRTLVNDLHRVTLYARKKYGNDIPLILFGHSMGSFLARRYMSRFGEELSGAIISGTGYQPAFTLAVGMTIARFLGTIKGEKYRPELIELLAFGNYNKRIDNHRTTHDWLTKDEKIVDKYLEDKYCTFDFTVNGYKTLFGAIRYIQRRDSIEKIPKNLPIFIISGKDDPVGNYGEGPKKICEQYILAGIKDVSIRLYENDRHELTNEIDKEEVFEDIWNWLSKKFKFNKQ